MGSRTRARTVFRWTSHKEAAATMKTPTWLTSSHNPGSMSMDAMSKSFPRLGSAPWAEQEPTQDWLLELLLALSFTTMLASVAIKRRSNPGALLEQAGVAAGKIQRALRE